MSGSGRWELNDVNANNRCRYRRGRGGYGGGGGDGGQYRGGNKFSVGRGFGRGGGGDFNGRGRGKWGSDRGRGGWHMQQTEIGTQQWQSTSVGIPGTSESAEEIIEHWSNASAPLLPLEEHLKFEKPKTNVAEEAMQLTQDLYSKRGLVRDDDGTPISDCRGFHELNRVCMFCDGRSGHWVRDYGNGDQMFINYQNSIIQAAHLHLGSKSGISLEERKKLAKAAISQEAPLAIEEDDEEDFGLVNNDEQRNDDGI